MNSPGWDGAVELALATAAGVRILPVLHERVDLAAVARRVLDALDPALVAVELPATLEAPVRRAIERLPRLSAVLSFEAEVEPMVWIVVPGDPLVEGLRWALERGREIALIDPDVPYPHRRHDVLPDPQVLWRLGPKRALELLTNLGDDAPHDDADALRERGMAHRLAAIGATHGDRALALVGAAHVRRVIALLEGPTAPPIARLRRTHTEVRHLDPDSLSGILVDAPLAHAAYELLRDGRRPASTPVAAAVAPRVEIETDGLRLVTTASPASRSERHHALAAWAAREAAVAPRDGRLRLDRARLGLAVLQVATESYREQTRETVQRWQTRLYTDVARRLARVQGLLVPGLFEWVAAARGVADDNLAWEVFDAARTYPWQEAEAELPTVRVDGDMLDLGTRRIRFRRRFFRVKQRPLRVPVRRRPPTDDPSAWLDAFSGEGICSYPPEDVVIEEFGRHLQRRALSNVAAERTRSEPFSTGMLDGVDLAETLRHWHDREIWVRLEGLVRGGASSVVVVFDPDRDGSGFPYLMTWLGEHDQESDMAMYATDPTRHVVGPGMMRATYGGFLLTSPPGRLYDVWRDPDYRRARSKPEVLLMAAIDYSLEPHVVHVGPQPPSGRIRDYAAANRRRLIHLPLGSLSPPALRRLRTVHILDGRQTRQVARDYIW